MQTHICMFQTFLLNLITSDIDSSKPVGQALIFEIKYSSRGLFGVTFLVHEVRPSR